MHGNFCNICPLFVCGIIQMSNSQQLLQREDLNGQFRL